MAYNITKPKPASTTKKLVYLIAIVACLVVIHNLAVSTYDLWHKQDLVSEANSDLQREKSENQALQKQLKTVKSPQFLEEQARNELFMVKPGESGVILPPNIGESSTKKEPNLAPWQKWLKLFVGI